MTDQPSKRIADLERWLEANPNHPDRTTIESDLRKLRDQERTYERDTFDIINHNFKH